MEMWHEDLLTDGVWHHDKRLPVCPFDVINSDWGAIRLMNCCSESLKFQIKEILPSDQRSFCKVLCTIVLLTFRPTATSMQETIDELKNLKLSDFPAESMSLFEAAAIPKLHLIYTMNRNDAMPTTLVADAITGIGFGTSQLFQNKFGDLALAVNEAEEDEVNDLTPQAAIQHMVKI